MQQVNQQEKRYRWIGIAVAGVALLGWLFGLYFWSVANEAEEQLAEQTALYGTAEDLTLQIAALRDEADEAIVLRDQNTGELDSVSQRLEQLQGEFTTLDEESTALRTERDTMQTELEQGRAELSEIETALAQTQDRITESSQELSDVGERLEEARQQEANLQATISELSDEASQLSEEAAGAEERVQAARDAEASLEQRLQSAQSEQAEIESTRDSLQQSVDTLTQQRDDLANDAIAAEEQVQALQNMTGELSQLLAERSEQLRQIEERMGNALNESGANIRTEASGISTDTPYEHEQTRIVFAPDGTFEMTNTRHGRSVTGSYEVSEDTITLDEAEGDVGNTEFPISCGVTVEADQFSLEDSDGSCAVLDGVTFTRADG